MTQKRTRLIKSSYQEIITLDSVISIKEVTIACKKAEATYQSDRWIDNLMSINSRIARSKAQLEKSLEMDVEAISQPITL